MTESLISIPLSDYVKEVGGFAAVGRMFGITGEGVKKRLDTGQVVHVRVDPATREPKDAIVVKKIWDAA
ncbi:MAG TPA: hypothetical protein VFM10_01650 [Terriglobales bacterium]|nr:hypothetical protein [Terriglobales bacterium]